MPVPNIGPPCPFCGRPTSIAKIETHPALPEIDLRTFCCEACGPVRTVASWRINSHERPRDIQRVPIT